MQFCDLLISGWVSAPRGSSRWQASPVRGAVSWVGSGAEASCCACWVEGAGFGAYHTDKENVARMTKKQ